MANLLHPALVGFADIRPQAIDDWQQYKLEGRQYLNLAETALSQKEQDVHHRDPL